MGVDMDDAAAADIIYLQPRTGRELPEGALPASLEFRGPHGIINYFLTAAPSSALCARPEAAALGRLESLKLYENEDGGWKLCLRGQQMDSAAVEYPIAAAEVAALLEKNGIGMPGRVQNAPAPLEAAGAGQAEPEQAEPAEGDGPPLPDDTLAPPEAELPPF